MANMIPPVFSEEVRSSGERQIFEKIKSEPGTDTWTCLHSLGLARHVSQSYGEIDFVLLVPGEGIACLEVKSGKVSRKSGTWEYTDKYSQKAHDTRGPFTQASDAMHSLKNYVAENLGKRAGFNKILFTWGVIFPHCGFDKTDPACEDWQISNNSDRDRTISLFVKNLFKNAHEKSIGKKWYHPSKSRPSKEQISELVSFLRGDFEFCVKKGSAIRDLEDEILHLTREQVLCLDNLRLNKRCLFTGAAGTGKTVLAVEFARRQALERRRTLFLCFNRLLANKLAEDLSGFSGFVKVDTFHHYIDDLVSRSSYSEEFRQENDKVFVHSMGNANTLFRELYPYYAELALGEGHSEPYETVVMDEAQDLIFPPYLDVIDSLIQGGLAGGRWAFFGDLFTQRIFSYMSGEQLLEEMDKRAPAHMKYSLNVNCRNTRNIGRDTCRLAGFDEPPYLDSRVSGPPVEYKYYADPKEHHEILRKTVGELGSDGIPRSGITILSRHTLKNSHMGAALQKIKFKICDISSKEPVAPGKDSVNFCTIAAFKGLESQAIIVSDIQELESENSRDLLYVAMSRAMLKLVMILPDSLRHEVNRMLKE